MSRVDERRVIGAPVERVWQAWFDPRDAESWLGVTRFEMPEQPGERFLWEFDPGCESPHHYRGSVRRLSRPAELVLDWDLPTCEVVTALRLTLDATPDGSGTRLHLEHAGFPESVEGQFEYDGYAHHWPHYLDWLENHLTARPVTHRHRARIGLVPVGAAKGVGLLVKGVVRGSPAQAAGLRAGDVVRGADATAFDSMDDFDEWIDAREPGEVVLLRLERGDLAVELAASPSATS